MLPLSDADVHRHNLPVVNIALIAINTLVFLYELTLNSVDTQVFFLRHGLIPLELTSRQDFQSLIVPGGLLDIDSPLGAWGTVFSSMFMHGGFMHFAGNMIFLWVFGDNIEDRLGHVKYLLFYLGAGLAATWTQVAIDPSSQIPLIGASGAISGVLGAYLLTYPYSRIRTLIIFYFITFIRIPAVYLLGFWFALQFFQGIGSLGVSSTGGGVAFFAHIGGFVAGLLFIALYKLLRRERLWPRRPVWHVD